MKTIALVATLGFGLTAQAAIAQIVPDGTVGTTVSGANIINNGTRTGNNLFHSFSQFSIPTGNSATFNNALDIQNIFTRITGNTQSSIDGLIQAQGSANLFLMNPNGIVFGPNAKLNIGGSFLGTTANSIKFSDGVQFSASDVASNPLLTVSLPIGLQMGQNAAPIQAQGTGYTNTIKFITRLPNSPELQVKPGKTLALVGGNLQLNGFMLTAPQGRVELGSTSGAGQVNLIPNAQGYTLGYETGQNFGDIQLLNKSLLDVSGVNAGSIEVQGRNIHLTDGSLALAQNYGNLSGGDIRFQASTGIDFIGKTNDGELSSGIRSETYGTGASGNVSILTPQLNIQQGGGVNTVTYGSSVGGNIQIDAKVIEISGSSPTNPTAVSNITTLSYGSGSAGNISTNGDSLLVSGGSTVSSVIYGSGSSGQVAIRNNNTIVKGESPFGLYSSISLPNFGIGNSKDLSLDTGKLQILDGGTVGSSAFVIGNGGNISINARESIAISGSSNNNNSSINSSSIRLPGELRQLLGLPDILTANAGNVSITTPNLILTNGGTVSVTGQGSGNAGILKITSDRIQLENQGLIQAQTESGNGGNINLQVGSLLLMRNQSKITATTRGLGDGGNININTPILVGLENSDIVANAVKGRGGNIQISTQGIIGLEYRPQLTPENDITASSEFGINGTVKINSLGLDPSSGLVKLDSEFVDASRSITNNCGENQGNSLINTGRGGIPQDPMKITIDRPWNDIRPLNTSLPIIKSKIQDPKSKLIEASIIQRDSDGGIVLVGGDTIGLADTTSCSGIALDY